MSKFNKYDYVETKDGMIDGILTELEEDGSWKLESHWGNGGFSTYVDEDEIKLGEVIPKHYQEIIEYYKAYLYEEE
jgi:hypothetical protein